MVLRNTTNKHADEPGQYVEVAPTDGELGDLEAAFHQYAAGDHTLVIYLVSTDDAVRYIIGHPNTDEAVEFSAIRRLFPNGTAITHLETPPLDPFETAEEYATAVVHGIPDRRRDWQTPLTPHTQTTIDSEGTHSPLNRLVDTLAATTTPVLYQALIEPHNPYDYKVENRKLDLELSTDTTGQKLANMIFGYGDDDSIPESNQDRLESINEKDHRHPLAVTPRLIATGPTAHKTIDQLTGTFNPASGPHYHLRLRHTPDKKHEMIRDAILNEDPGRDSYRHKLTRRLPLAANHRPRIITDPRTAPHFAILDPNNLSDVATRHTTHQPQEHTGRKRPGPDTLAHYQTDGLTLGLPQTIDTEPADESVALPPSLQPMHVAWFGRTGAGKSTALTNAILDNHHATDGADILIDPKGDGMPREYLQAHYRHHGTLDNVYYLDCRQHLPALSVFDIRQDIEAGIDRTTAVIDKVDHYVDILEQLIGRDQYQDAIRSTDLVRYLLRACFDPVHGEDAFSHQQFLETITRMQTTQEAPAVSDDDLSTALQGVTATHRDSFMKVMHGVKTRVEEIVTDQRLTQIFNHVPTGDDPHLHFDDLLNEDCVLILDTGGLRTRSQRVLTLVILADLWAALRRRKQTHPDDPPLVNLYLEEAANVAASQILRDLLAQGRGFNVSVTLATQFPAQLQDNHGTLEEVLNNVSTVVTGNVPDDQALARRFATSTHDPADIASRLRALNRGEWLATLPAPFMEDVPQPFQLQSAPIPPGHPESTQPLSELERHEFHADLDAHQTQLTDQLALDFTTHTTLTTDDPTQDDDPPTEIVSTTLPHTQRLPQHTDYDPHRHALRCTSCDNYYAPTIQGLIRTIQCCNSLTDVDRDNIPTIAINLKLSPQEIKASDYTPKQLGFLQVVHTAQHQRYTDLEYDLSRDSMVRLREYVDIDRDAIQHLVDDGLLRKDTDYPHRLYSVTAQGRQEINEATREGLDHGDGHGDLGETSQHRMAVTLGQEYLEQEYVDDPESPATHTAAYYPIHDTKRLDAAALDDDDTVVVALEAERVNNDLKEAAPADYDKMAACEPEEAIWIAMNRDGAHKILDALKNPADGDPRVELDYNKTTAPRRFKLDAPGATQMYTLSTIQNTLD